MKPWRTPLILFTVVVVLAGLAYWDEWQTRQDEQQENQKHRLISVTADQVKQVTLEKAPAAAAEDSLIKLVKRDSSWWLEQPVEAEATAQTVDDLLANVVEFRYERRLPVEDPELADYGLAEPAFRLTLEAASGVQETLLIGDKLPVGYSVYVKRADQPVVYVGSQTIRSTVDKKPFDLRTKDLGLPSFADVDKLELTNHQGTTIVLKRGTNREWQFVQPASLTADTAEIRDYWYSWQQQKAQEFIDKPSPSLTKALAVTNPGTVQLGAFSYTTAEGEAKRWSVIRNGDSIYARKDQVERWVRLGDDVVELMAREPSDFQMRDVFQFDSNRLTKLEVDGQVFEKRDGQWVLAEGEGGPLATAEIADFIVDLEFARADTIWQSLAEAPDLVKQDPQHRLVMHLPDHVALKVAVWLDATNDRAVFKKEGDNHYFAVSQQVVAPLEPGTDKAVQQPAPAGPGS
jgi:hypothetical protein